MSLPSEVLKDCSPPNTTVHRSGFVKIRNRIADFHKKLKWINKIASDIVVL